MTDLDTQVDELITRVCGTAEVLDEPDLDLFEAGVLDSLGAVELLVELGEFTGVHVAPTEADREEFSSVTRIREFARSLQ